MDFTKNLHKWAICLDAHTIYSYFVQNLIQILDLALCYWIVGQQWSYLFVLELCLIDYHIATERFIFISHYLNGYNLKFCSKYMYIEWTFNKISTLFWGFKFFAQNNIGQHHHFIFFLLSFFFPFCEVGQKESSPLEKHQPLFLLSHIYEFIKKII